MMNSFKAGTAAYCQRRRAWGRQLLVMFMTLSGLGTLQAAELHDVSATSLAEGRVQLSLELTDAAPEPNIFATKNPPRLILDLPGVSNGLAQRDQIIGVGVAKSLKVVEAGGRTRLMLDLVRSVPYHTRVDGSHIYLALGDNNTAAIQPAAKAQTVNAANAANVVKNVDFRRGEHGEGRLIVTLSDPSVPVDVRDEDNRIIVDFMHTTLPDELERRLDVTDFATPVQMVDSYSKDDQVQMVIVPIGHYEHMVYQANDRLIIDVKESTEPVIAAMAEEKKPDYTGEKLSLNFQDIEVRAVLQIIADFTDLNIVASDSVTGNITLRLQNVPWDEALDIILKTKGLDMRRMGNIILVAPGTEIAEREKNELEARKQREELAPLRKESLQINYAKASDLAALLKSKENSLLSSRGNITIDERTNKLLIQDTQENLGEIRALVEELDIPIRQVMIESRIVIANSDFSRDLGARFGATGAGKYGNDGVVVGSGSLGGTGTMVDSAVNNLQGGSSALPVTTPSLGDRLNVNLPVQNPAGQLALAVLSGNYLLDMELTALQMEGRGEVVSNPRVITSNQKEAVIEQGVEIPYQQASSSGATSVAFKKAVLSLTVVPQVTPDDRIIMDLQVSKDSVGQIFNGVPSVNTREVNTQVLVDDGDTVVLGGIYEQTSSKEVDSVPFFGSLPIIGALFRQTREVDDKAELLIFVTPKILREGLSIN